MYITTSSSSSSALLRASRALYSSSSISRFALSRTSPQSSSPSLSNLQHQHRSVSSVSSAFRSLRTSVPRWSHGVDWRSPASLRAQIRTVAPVFERFERRIATMASEHAFKGILTTLTKPGGGEIGKYYSLPALNDPRIGNSLYNLSQ